MSFFTILAVSVGGALGAWCRNRASTFLKPRFRQRIPLPTLFINLTSCAIAGIALYFQGSLNQVFYLALTMGFLGGFSTLSTMNYEAVELIMQKHFKEGFGYLALTYASTIGIAALGFGVASLIFS